MGRQECCVCKVCGHNRVLRPSLPNPFDVSTDEFIQIREGGGKVATGKKGRGQGRGVGWVKVDSISLREAVASGGKYLELARDFAEQISKVSEELKKLGLMP